MLSSSSSSSSSKNFLGLFLDLSPFPFSGDSSADADNFSSHSSSKACISHKSSTKILNDTLSEILNFIKQLHRSNLLSSGGKLTFFS